MKKGEASPMEAKTSGFIYGVNHPGGRLNIRFPELIKGT
jgi:hypothetical protein